MMQLLHWLEWFLHKIEICKIAGIANAVTIDSFHIPTLLIRTTILTTQKLGHPIIIFCTRSCVTNLDKFTDMKPVTKLNELSLVNINKHVKLNRLDLGDLLLVIYRNGSKTDNGCRV